MPTYHPETFAGLFNSQLGQDIWKLLIKPDIVARLETASELGKPAVEGIQEQLLEAFGEEILADRVKQMVGHMVRQIMEQHGWALDQAEVKVQSVPFIKAARYKRPEWATFHAFRNSRDPRDVVISATRQTGHLPAGVRWIYYVTFASPLKAAVAFGVTNLEQLRKQVQQHGFHRVHVERMLRRA